MKTKNAFILLIALFVVISFSCKKDESTGYTVNKNDTTDNTNDDDPIIQGESKIYGIAKDAISFTNLGGATIEVVDLTSEVKNSSEQITVSDDGTYDLSSLSKGMYKLTLTHNSYNSMVADSVELGDGPVFVAFLPAPDSIQVPVGCISGLLVNETGYPVGDAIISISAEDETLSNGYFSTVKTNAAGEFFIGAVPIMSSEGSYISNFKIRCIKANYKVSHVLKIKIKQNKVTPVAVILEPGNDNASAENLFSEDFEDGAADWYYGGFWHVQQNAAIKNAAYPVYVKLAPNDLSNAMIPNAYEGSKQAWYGESASGNFLSDQFIDTFYLDYDDTLNGGTSMTDNWGIMVSPEIDLTSQTTASVNFYTWYEIESVNPNEEGYDIMQIEVISGSDTTIVKKLNPYQDPILKDRDAIPYTSGGFNKAPEWTYQEIDLSDFTGQKIKLAFRFMTVDELYNGFRGWFVDNINITNLPSTSAKQAIEPYKKPTPRSRK